MPESVQARVGLARVALEREAFQEAVKVLEEAILREPSSHLVSFLYGRALRGVGETERAEELLVRGQQNPNEKDLPQEDPFLAQVDRLRIGAKTLGERADQALEKGRSAQALELYHQAVASSPEWPLLRVRYARALEQASYRDAAAVQLEKALELDPGLGVAHLRLGHLALRAGEVAAAETSYRNAVTADPELAEAWYSLGAALRGTGRLEEALTNYERAVRLDPTQDLFRHGRDLTLLGMDRWDEARAALARDVDAFPGSPPLRLLLARVLAASPDPSVRDGEEALSLAREALHRAPLPAQWGGRCPGLRRGGAAGRRRALARGDASRARRLRRQPVQPPAPREVPGHGAHGRPGAGGGVGRSAQGGRGSRPGTSRPVRGEVMVPFVSQDNVRGRGGTGK